MFLVCKPQATFLKWLVAEGDEEDELQEGVVCERAIQYQNAP